MGKWLELDSGFVTREGPGKQHMALGFKIASGPAQDRVRVTHRQCGHYHLAQVSCLSR